MANPKMFRPLAVSALALGCLGIQAMGLSAAEAADIPPGYNYPYTDSWLATASVALLKDPKLPEKQVKDMTVYPARARTPLFDDKARVYYVTYRQEHPADLVVLISGLGSVAEDPLALYMGGVLFAMGYNVIVVPDAFNWQFALGASRTGYVGVPSIDAGDLETFIVRARDHAVHKDGMQVLETKLVGYSMGALEGAFLAAREAQHPRIDFAKVVLLNPPVDTFYDLRQLDRLSETGQNWSAEEKKTIKARAFKLVADANLTDPQGAPYFRDLNTRNTLTDDQLKFVLFGLFRKSLQDVIMVTQQIHDLGILKTPAGKLNLDAREAEAGQYGFEDYLQKFVEPRLGLTQAQLQGETLYGLHDFLASHREVEIFHNADDFLVRPKDIDYLRATLQNRLTLFPHGGHMGNVWYPVNQQMLAQALGSGPVPAPAQPVLPPTEPPAAAPDAAVAATAPAAPAGGGAPAPAAAESAQTAPAPAAGAAAPQPTTETARATPAIAPAAGAPTSLAPPSQPAAGPETAQAAPPAGGAVAPNPVPATAAVEPPMPQPLPAIPAPAPSSPSPPDTALSPPDAAPAPTTGTVEPVPATPGTDPLAVTPPGTTVTTTTATTPAPPTYKVTIPQIPSATPPASAQPDRQPPS